MKYLFALLSILILPLHTACADDGAYKITIENVYAYPTATMQKNGAVFMDIRNTMPKPDRIIAAYADTVADRVELHTHTMDGDIMMMRRVDGFDVPGGAITKLEPMGDHIMLMGLKKPLIQGEIFRLTLDFQHGDDKTVIVKIGMPDDKNN